MDTLNTRIMLYSTKGVMLLGVKIIKYEIFQSDNLTTFLTSGEEWKNHPPIFVFLSTHTSLSVTPKSVDSHRFSQTKLTDSLKKNR